MPIYLDTRTRANLAIAVCARCAFKFPQEMLFKDGNIPSLRVCRQCWDPINPYRLPPHPTDNLALEWTRPNPVLVMENAPYDPNTMEPWLDTVGEGVDVEPDGNQRP